jgi:hypothetical protein
VGTVPPATTAGAGASEGSALTVDNAAGAPGAAFTVVPAGAARGDNVFTDDDNVAEPPSESGCVIEGTNGVPAWTLLCAIAGEVAINSSIAKPMTSAMLARGCRSCRRIRSSSYIFTDYCSRFGAQTSQTVLDIIASRIGLCKLQDRKIADGRMGRT